MGIENLSGRTLGNYRLEGLLGRGGMGAVYRAYQVTMERTVALKVLPGSLAEDPRYMERFQREAKIATALEHPHIVPVYEYGTVDEVSYVAMRLLGGGSLTDRIEAHLAGQVPPMRLEDEADLLTRLASALDYAHRKGVIHRDIKPSNVMFDEDQNPFLVDFGIAKLLHATGLTGTGMTMGTPPYMAPEQWKSLQPVPATDQYALGIMMYALLTNKMPFEAPTPFGYMNLHINETPPMPQTYRADIPPAVGTVLQKALAKDPNSRYPSVGAFAQAFDSAVRVGTRTAPIQHRTAPPAPTPTPGTLPLPYHAQTPPPSGPVPAAKKPGFSWMMAGGIGVTVLGILAVLFILLSGGGDDDNGGTTSGQAGSTVPPTANLTFVVQTDIAQTAVSGTEVALGLQTAEAALTDEAAVATDTPLDVTAATEEASVDATEAVEATEIAAATEAIDATEEASVDATEVVEATEIVAATEAVEVTEEASVDVTEVVEATEVVAATEVVDATEEAGVDATEAVSVDVTEAVEATEDVEPTDAASVTEEATEEPANTPTSAIGATLTMAAAEGATISALQSATAAAQVQPSATPTQVPTDVPTATNTATPSHVPVTATYTATPTNTPTQIPPTATDVPASPTPTESQPTQVPLEVTLTAVAAQGATISALQTATAVGSGSTDTPPPVDTTPEATEEVSVTEEPTDAPTSTPFPTTVSTPADPLVVAEAGVRSNADWTPLVSEIDGVEMVLVPAGCFTMGTTSEDGDAAFAACEELGGEDTCDRTWYEDEEPAHEVCFEEPFWIDRSEVTNAQFEEFGGEAARTTTFVGSDVPRETVTWFEARDYCQLRGGRLPTEAEWEYVARGPDGLQFPWGADFDSDNVAFLDTANLATVETGLYPAGASWVGALDMSGNVREWVSSIYGDYPYNATDGRENENNSTDFRTTRGGSWRDTMTAVRSSYRLPLQPDSATNFVGMRCVLTFDAVSDSGTTDGSSSSGGASCRLTNNGTHTINMRSAPDTGSNNVLGTLEPGDQVVAVARNGHGWYRLDPDSVPFAVSDEVWIFPVDALSPAPASVCNDLPVE